MKVDNTKVYDLAESIIASGLPMLAKYDAYEFKQGSIYLKADIKDSGGHIELNRHIMRAKKLASCQMGTGHDNFLAGITVAFNVTATQTWWLQFGRYHFAQIVSSQSKMHRLREMLGEKETEGKSDDELIADCPMSFELTARVTTNYRQLKTIYHQRKTHRLQEWLDFCEWIKSLPFAKNFITNEEQE